jgi:hypothetical protein
MPPSIHTGQQYHPFDVVRPATRFRLYASDPKVGEFAVADQEDLSCHQSAEAVPNEDDLGIRTVFVGFPRRINIFDEFLGNLAKVPITPGTRRIRREHKIGIGKRLPNCALTDNPLPYGCGSIGNNICGFV